jgi:hypothetical protein
MVIPSEQLSIAYFCKWFFIITFASMLFSWFVRSLLLLDFFVSTSIFFPVQPMIFDSPLNPEESAWFTFSLLTSWSNQGARIKSVRFVRGLLSPFLTVMVYKTTASGLDKPALYPNMEGISVSCVCYISDTHIKIIIRLTV